MQSYAVVGETHLTPVRTALNAAEQPRSLPQTPDGGRPGSMGNCHHYLAILDPTSRETESISEGYSNNDHLYEEATGVWSSGTADIYHEYITILDPPPPEVKATSVDDFNDDHLSV